MAGRDDATDRFKMQFKVLPDDIKAAVGSLAPYTGADDSRSVDDFVTSLNSRFNDAKTALKTTLGDGKGPADMDQAYFRTFLRASLVGEAADWFDVLTA